jgi:hypothetical protein
MSNDYASEKLANRRYPASTGPPCFRHLPNHRQKMTATAKSLFVAAALMAEDQVNDV